MMGVLDILLGRDEQGNPSKINMALIALLLWRWYQSTQQAGGGAQPMPSPLPSPRDRAPVPDPSAPIPNSAPAQIPSSGSDGAGNNDFGPLIESSKRMPDFQRGGGGRSRPIDDDGGVNSGGGTGGGLGDILGDILRGGQGGRGGPAGGPSGGGSGGGGLGDILGDILSGGRGMPGGPGGGRSPADGGMSGGGLGDILGDILGGGRGRPTSRVAGPQGDPLGGALSGGGGLAGGLGGLLAGGAAGGILGDLLKQFDQSGQGAAARSWVSSGENVPVTPTDIEKTFGSGIINQLADQFGMNKSELLQGLSQTLPGVVDQLTPDGRLPTDDEISRWK